MIQAIIARNEAFAPQAANGVGAGQADDLSLSVVSMLLGGLLVGSDILQIALNLPVVVAYMLSGLILFSVLGMELLVGHRLVWKRRR